MKSTLIILLTLILLNCSAKKEDLDIIHLPLKEVNGFGSFKKSFSVLPWNSSEKAAQETKGIPKDWQEFYVNQIWLDAFQTVYPEFVKQGFSESKFNKRYATWTKNPHQRKLSKKPINSYVNLVFRENNEGIIEYILDTNNNKDFSDEEIRTPLKVDDHFNYSLPVKKAPFVAYELNTNNKVLNKKVKVLILVNSKNNLAYSFPQVFETSFLDKKIQVSHGFANVTFDEKSSLIIDDKKEEIGLYELIKIDSTIYKNLGINIKNNTLILQRLPKNKELFSTSVGYKAIPFKIKKLNAIDSISLLDYSGKFLYIDFWGTWCAPCLTEIPTICDAYEKTSRKDIEFLGIAVHDTKEKLESSIQDFSIKYPQALESDSKNLKKKYNIISFPTTFLIDRKGKIVAKNLKGEKLLDSLNYYIKNYED
ncbi:MULTISPECIES: TlpA family protein disulfide reductase [unclassified Polaribacter]|uniref:TlpA family protein disulfide reductase n=1 Tax=unclassified Polaribacter TaxID=196858 RepID=UPI0011BF4A7D|nr:MULTISPECIES: TlpA disulfide reductase family protein [unclassified Polaribacter]TXD50567.1 TlpA family protein disulfide reductase [Polaribacter sp. IC063]TXD62022.1 TlpA family protein disulfide reductase [Polaribacter sp. IC066]